MQCVSSFQPLAYWPVRFASFYMAASITFDSDIHGDLNSMSLLEGNRLRKQNAKLHANIDCLTNTGGTCVVQNCLEWRGPTNCSWGGCYCQPGHCAGSDGKCYSKTYGTLLDRFRIRNVRWPDMYLYVSWFWFWNKLYVSSDGATSAGEFNLKELPDGDFILLSSLYPDYMIKTDYFKSCTGNQDKTTHCTESYMPMCSGISSFVSPSVPAAALRFTTAPDGSSVMISSNDYPSNYWYIPHFSWTLNTHYMDPGTGGYWVFDPPLPKTTRLESYRGRRCAYDCGGTLPRETVNFLVGPLLMLVLAERHLKCCT